MTRTHSIQPYTKQGRRPMTYPAEVLRTTLEKGLDKAFSKYIKLRDKGECVMSGEKRNVGLSHFYGSEACPNLRWDERNVHVMCNREHALYHTGNVMHYVDWMNTKYNEDTMAELRRLAEGIQKYYTVDKLISISQEFGKKILDLQKRKGQ